VNTIRLLGLQRKESLIGFAKSTMDKAITILEVLTVTSKAIPVVGNYLEGILGTTLQLAKITEVRDAAYNFYQYANAAAECQA
jgi:hypothetical protein